MDCIRIQVSPNYLTVSPQVCSLEKPWGVLFGGRMPWRLPGAVPSAPPTQDEQYSRTTLLYDAPSPSVISRVPLSHFTVSRPLTIPTPHKKKKIFLFESSSTCSTLIDQACLSPFSEHLCQILYLIFLFFLNHSLQLFQFLSDARQFSYPHIFLLYFMIMCCFILMKLSEKNLNTFFSEYFSAQSNQLLFLLLLIYCCS